MNRMRVAYPGSFSPPTHAHLAIASAAHRHFELATVEWVVSRDALGKAHAAGPTLEARVEVLHEAAAEFPWLTVSVTEHRFIADIADGYDAIVVGADKWRQVLDPSWYADADECERMRARLGRVLVVPRHDDDLADLDDRRGIDIVTIEPEHRSTSSSSARAGDVHLMLPAARAFAERTGHWTR